MSTSAISRTALSLVFATLLTALGGCGLVGPSCKDENGTVFNVSGQVAPDGVASYSVTSPKNSKVDGSQGKTYRVDVTGDSARDANFTLNVSYRITCER